MCCLIFSRRGLAYFGVLIQLLVCLLLIPVITVPVGITLGVSPTTSSGRDLSRWQVGFVVGYSCGMCFTAILIFRGIQTESFNLISSAVASLLLLQSLAAGVTAASWTTKVPLKGELNKGTLLLRAAIVALNLTSTVAYTSLLVIYARVLKAKKSLRRCGNKEEEEDSEEDSYGGRTTRTSSSSA